MKKKSEIVIHPIITEKSTGLQEMGKYSFKVDRRANKKEIMRAVREVFGVNPVSCSIINVGGKMKRVRIKAGYTASWKKAIVTLKKGEKLELFSGV